MGFIPTVNGSGGFTATVNGQSALLAGMSTVGIKGDPGAAGPAGVVAATAPITYNAGTQTVGISPTPTFTSVSATTGNITTVNLTTANFADATSQTTAFVGEARKLYTTARNSTGSTIAKGKVVYLSGGTGNVPNVSLAQANSEATSARTIGITAEAIANNSNGKVIISGAVENIDTSAFADGDTVYLSATTAGGLTATLPQAPLHGVVIGIVTRANPSVGSIEVAINNYQELKELSDVSVADRANNDGLFWEASSSTWRSKTVAEVLGYTPANAASVLLSANNLSDLASASTARTNLGLGTAATASSSSFAAAVHTHAFSDIVSGVGIIGAQVVASSSESVAQAALGLGSAATQPSSAFAAAVHTHTASQISDSTTAGRALLTAADASAQRTSLGLGTMATAAASDYLAKADNLSGLTSVSTARSNLGLGTMATETASNYAPLASPTFTGDPKAPTPSTSDNDTSIATTAFVNAYCPAASTSTAGKVQLATDTEALTKTSTTKAVTPSNLIQLNLGVGRMSYPIASFSTATSGTGGTNDTLAQSRRLSGPTSTGAGYVSANQGFVPNRGQSQALNIDWTRRIRIFARLQREAASPSSNSIYRFVLGETTSTFTGDPTVRSIGIKVTGTGAINALAHDGTTLTTIATSFTPTNGAAFDLVIESDGAGNVTWYANDSQIATTSLGPKTYLSGSNSQNGLYTKIENTASFTSGPQAYLCYTPCAEYLP